MNGFKCEFCDKILKSKSGKRNHEKRMHFNLLKGKYPYVYKSVKEYPHRVARRGEKWKENRKKRIEKSNNECEWCGAKKYLQISHERGHHFPRYKKLWNDVLKKNGAQSHSVHVKLYEEAVKKRLEEYLSMNNTEVLCRRCHFAYKKKLVLCECKKYYHKKRDDKCKKCREKVLKLITSE